MRVTRSRLGAWVAIIAAAAAAWLLAPAAQLDGIAEPAGRIAPASSQGLPGADGSTRGRASAVASAASAAALALERLDRVRGTDAEAEVRFPTKLFAAHSWQPPAPPPPKPAAAPAPPPQAPPFDYTYFGRYSDGGVSTAYFAKGTRVVALRVGEDLDGFRFEALEAGRATFTYLPLGQSVSLNFGSSP